MMFQSSPKPRRPLWVAAFIGLSGGLLLSVPLSRLSGDQSLASMPLPLGNPFGSWAGFGPKEIVVLGRDASGSNTDVIFTVRVQGGRTTITQIPRDSYIESDGFATCREIAVAVLRHYRGDGQNVPGTVIRAVAAPEEISRLTRVVLQNPHLAKS